MQTNRLRWGVLGTARIADRLVTAIRESDNSTLSAIASREIGLAQAWAAEREVPNAFGSYEEMLASDVIDAVYIPLPNGLHKEWSIKAMQSGKHVLCEKPLTSSAAEVEEIIAASEATGMKVMEAFMYRFHPQVALMQQLLADGAIGDVKIIRASFGFRLTRPNDVRWSADMVGGALMDVGSYCVNKSRLIAGGEPLRVHASQIIAPSGVDMETVGVLEFADGALAAIDCSFETGPIAHQGVTISGTEGRMYMANPFAKDGATEIVINDAGDAGRDGKPYTVQVPEANQYQLMLEHFADAVLNDHPVAYTLQNSLGNMRTIDALKKSAQLGKSVEPEK